MQRYLARSVALLVAVLALAPVPPSILAQAGERCFPETGFCITGEIRQFWERNGGLPVFGFPIGPQQEAQVEGQPRQVQWFERNRLELHPENRAPYNVLVGRLGADRLEQQGRAWQGFAKSQAQPGCRFYPETGHNVCGAFLATYGRRGLELDDRRSITEAESLALWGLPLSDAQQETLGDGRSYTVQWFERARLE
ncbi:MAG: CAP domain-containing protein, partial [Chloroflexales bacterium]|nr:CAP domain-containing protein [Chloroflexales bacterium]